MSSSNCLKVMGLALFTAALLLAAPTQARAEAAGNVNFTFGLKKLSENDWQPVENQREFGIQTDWGGADWPINIAADILVSKDDEGGSAGDFDGNTTEIGVGVRKTWTLTSSCVPISVEAWS